MLNSSGMKLLGPWTLRVETGLQVRAGSRIGLKLKASGFNYFEASLNQANPRPAHCARTVFYNT